MACEVKSKAAHVIALLNAARDQLLMSVYPIMLFCFSFSLTHTQSWTHNISKEKEFLRKLVKGGVIQDLTHGIWRHVPVMQLINSIHHITGDRHPSRWTHTNASRQTSRDVWANHMMPPEEVTSPHAGWYSCNLSSNMGMLVLRCHVSG